jgi:DNA-directed RNA polymerase beta subunit
MAIEVDKLKAMMRKTSAAAAIAQANAKDKDTVPDFELDDDGEEYMSIGTDGILASTEKLLAMNRGLVDPDERDSLKFQKVLRPHSMIRESIKMDAGKVARTAMYQAARRKNLQGMSPGAFDSYVNRLLVGNPLTAPLEEINPMQLVANARRITKMGPGGLGSDQSITEEAQNVHPSQFGLISVIEGPESARAGIDVRAAWGTKIGSNGRIYQKVYDRRKKKMRWMSAEDMDGLVIKLPD